MCNQKGTGFDLVVIKDANENKFLQYMIQTKFNNAEFWMGLKEEGVNTNTYIWVDGSGLEFGKQLGRGPWFYGEPNSVIRIMI